ncbi:hypothetical protein NQ317_008186 [Molorchus minor]|uniref:THO complex subunit 2 N-terminal domain-containing protein n=1 Tax=Molorchus minor TaxID=1323400 RepID=A0ABQ9JK50_9CUCU|nr:hypothetical protein NQ317_008186 [Molorchus minor]
MAGVLSNELCKNWEKSGKQELEVTSTSNSLSSLLLKYNNTGNAHQLCHSDNTRSTKPYLWICTSINKQFHTEKRFVFEGTPNRTNHASPILISQQPTVVPRDQSWADYKANNHIKACIQILKDESRTPLFDKNSKPTNIIKYINDLVDKGIKGILKKDAVVSTLQELVTLHADIPTVILDVLNVADAITSQTDSEEYKDRHNFSAIVKECEKVSFLSDKLLKERLEIDTLQEVVINNENLTYFREECEGFAKLLTELNNEFTENTESIELIGIVQSLIGCFNLDPNRVLDVILESLRISPIMRGCLYL